MYLITFLETENIRLGPIQRSVVTDVNPAQWFKDHGGNVVVLSVWGPY